MMSDLEKRQRLRDIEERLLTLQRNRALLDDHKAVPDATYDKAGLDLELQQLRQERQDLQEPGGMVIWDRINAMWKLVSDLNLDTRERWAREERLRHERQRQTDIWMMSITAWTALLTVALWWFGSQVWRITELWR